MTIEDIEARVCEIFPDATDEQFNSIMNLIAYVENQAWHEGVDDGSLISNDQIAHNLMYSY